MADPVVFTWLAPGTRSLPGFERARALPPEAANPTASFWPVAGVAPESADLVVTKGLLERTPWVRGLLKRAASLLRVGGVLEVHYFLSGDPYRTGQPVRPIGFLMYEASLALGHHFALRERRDAADRALLRFEKVKPLLAPDDRAERWTFGVVSNGRKNEQVMAIVRDVEAMRIPEFEVIVCGPPPAPDLPPFVRVIPDDSLGRDIRPATPAKKNAIVAAARYGNVAVMHDRFRFPADWWRNVSTFGNHFDLLAVPITHAGDGGRVLDWITFDNPIHEFRTDRVKLLAYDEWDPDVYIDGGLIVGKRDVLRRVPYDERLHWGEMEDLHLAKRLYLDGALVSLCTAAPVRTTSDRHVGVRRPGLRRALVKAGNLPRRARLAIRTVKVVPAFRRYLDDPASPPPKAR